MSEVIPGGLNNMIMHMAQRVSEQCFNPNKTSLNSGKNIDRNSPYTTHMFREIFHLKVNPTVTVQCTAKLVQINKKWYRNKSYINALNYLYNNLELADRLKPFLQIHRTIVHLRTEKDWVNIARMCERPGYCISIPKIAAKVNNIDAVVAIASNNTKRKYLQQIRHHFKGGLLKTQNHLTYTENAAIHMFSSVDAHTFWGNVFSTFTRGVAMIRSHRNLRTLTYNCDTRPYVLTNFDANIFTHICDNS